MNLAQAISAGLATAGTRPLLGLLDASGRGRPLILTGEQIAAQATGWQQRFVEAGLEPGDRVLLAPRRSPELAAVHLGALAAGLTVVPLNPSLTENETSRLVARCRPALTLLGNELSPSVAGAKGDGEDLALIIFTSGTTGQPKGVKLGNANLLYDLEALMRLWQIGPGDRVLHMLPAHHFHGLVLALYGPLMSAAEICILPRFEPRAVLDAIAEQGITVTMGVPTMYRRLLEAADPDDDLSGLRLALCGSAPLPGDLWQAFGDRFGVGLVERYGLTECGIISSNLTDAPVAGSVGRALPGTTITIRHEDGYHRAGTPGAARSGEVCVAGPSVMAGYLDDTDTTAAMVHDGYMHSGDLGRFDEKGNLYIDGRLKDLIIVGGTNVVPGEVEAALSGVDGVAELATVGRADDDLGEVVVAWVVADPGTDPGDLEQRLRDRATRELASYKRPRAYHLTGELPRNVMGKLDRRALAEQS